MERIRSRVDLLTPLRPSKARPTVPIETFAMRAISGIPFFFISRNNVYVIPYMLCHKPISGQPNSEVAV